MKTIHVAATVAFSALSLLSLNDAALAAGAYASDKISIWSGPNDFNPIVGMLQPGEAVTIDRCTATGNWCRVFHNGPTGWVPASYLVGTAAKIDATPLRSLTTSPFDDFRQDFGPTRHGGLF